jgi:uncharacterized membrane protein YkoI
MTKNKIAYALVAAVFAITVASMSFATAEPTEKNIRQFQIGAIASSEMVNPIPEINGSVNIGDDLLSKAKIDLAEATVIAQNEVKGTVTSASLAVQNSYLVYTVSVLIDNQIKTVIVDAGNGSVLHVTDGMPADVVSMLTMRHGPVFFHKTIAAPDLPNEDTFE